MMRYVTNTSDVVGERAGHSTTNKNKPEDELSIYRVNSMSSHEQKCICADSSFLLSHTVGGSQKSSVLFTYLCVSVRTYSVVRTYLTLDHLCDDILPGPHKGKKMHFRIRVMFRIKV